MPDANQGNPVGAPAPYPAPPVQPAPPSPPVFEPAQAKPAEAWSPPPMEAKPDPVYEPPVDTNKEPAVPEAPKEPEKPKYEWPTGPIGDIVQYMLSEQDVAAINRRRGHRGGPVLGQKHVGNYEVVGNVRPMMITRLWDDHHVSGQVFLDGNDTLWVIHAKDGTEPGQFKG